MLAAASWRYADRLLPEDLLDLLKIPKFVPIRQN
jgi:hypothetical protein